VENFYLLDTHALLWFLGGDERISTKSKNVIADPKNRCFISIASLWEMAIKMKIGKLDLDLEFKEFANYFSNYNIEILPIAFEHVLETMNLEDHHRDPFDSIIIAQAKHESWTIISKDENFPRYAQVKLIW
jgi:PIN domain nuclease of toxin-antitoxin system